MRAAGKFHILLHKNCKSTIDQLSNQSDRDSSIELFFDRVQVWLPIFHRPIFYQKYTKLEDTQFSLSEPADLRPDEVFMINGMFAMSARFSASSYFADVSPADRGAIFRDHAAKSKDDILKATEIPSFEFVRGMILLAFNYASAGLCGPASVLGSVLISFAYDLGLNKVDIDEPTIDSSDVEAWVEKEEVRRLWWAIWELDTFLAVLSGKPYGIDRKQMRVCLPVSDQNWFSRTPVVSAVLRDEPAVAWKTLQGVPNQDVRAWFLVAHYLLSHCAQHYPARSSSEEKEELERALACFKLALPAKFGIRSLICDGQNFAESSWIIFTHLMLLT
jgi:hypothetical protein